LCTSEAELSVIFFCAWEKTNAMEYWLSLASRAFNANHTAESCPPFPEAIDASVQQN